MSDIKTPRTKAFTDKLITDSPMQVDWSSDDAAEAIEFAKKLERELIQAQQTIAQQQRCPNGHRYIANSHEYPCPYCSNAKLEQTIAQKDGEIARLREAIDEITGIEFERLKPNTQLMLVNAMRQPSPVAVVPWEEIEKAFQDCLNIYGESVKFDGEDHYCGCCDMILSNGGSHKRDCILERFIESFTALSKSYAPKGNQ